MRFSRLLLVLAIFRHFRLLLEIRTKLIQLYTPFRVKQAEFSPSECTSLLQTSAVKLLAFFPKF